MHGFYESSVNIQFVLCSSNALGRANSTIQFLMLYISKCPQINTFSSTIHWNVKHLFNTIVYLNITEVKDKQHLLL